jgi:hypothetical protein
LAEESAIAVGKRSLCMAVWFAPRPGISCAQVSSKNIPDAQYAVLILNGNLLGGY